jgi:hypothetical protein
MLDRAPLVRSNSPDAVRARRSRARRRAGLAMFRFEYQNRRLIAALRASGRLGDTPTHAETEATIGRVLDDFCDRWLEQK